MRIHSPFPPSSLLVLVLGGALLEVATSALGQTPDTRLRATFESFEPTKPVWETHVAADANRAPAVSNQRRRSAADGGRIAYAIYDAGSGSWNSDGTIAMGAYTSLIDPSVARDAATGGFLVTATGDGPAGSGKHVVYSKYQPGSGFTAWADVAVKLGLGAYDKPWVVAGVAQEFYCLFWENPVTAPFGYEFRRTTNGGAAWIGGDVTVGGERVTGPAGQIALPPMQPSVYGSGPLYAAYRYTDKKIRFLQGLDRADGGVDFDHLSASCADSPGITPLTITLFRAGAASAFLPGTFSHEPGMMDFSVDPTDANRLYLVYCDTLTSTSADYDIFLRVITYNAEALCWTPSARIRVNQDNPNLGEFDQFCPQITVDETGRVHVIYYDDRNHDQSDTSTTPKFDVFYSHSLTHGATWGDDQELAAAPPDPLEPAWDRALWNDTGGFVEVGDYIGINYFQNTVWTTFTGTFSNDPGADKSVIYSSRIPW